MSDPVEIKTEKKIIAYLDSLEAMAGTFPYEGHGEEEMESFPRYIVTVAKSGGDLVGSGIYQLEMSIQGIAETYDAPRLATIKSAIIEALCLDSIAAIKAFVNADGYALSGIVFTGSDEGRDTEKNLSGFIVTYNVWAALTA